MADLIVKGKILDQFVGEKRTYVTIGDDEFYTPIKVGLPEPVPPDAIDGLVRSYRVSGLKVSQGETGVYLTGRELSIIK